MTCHFEGATRSKSKQSKSTEESPVQAGWKISFDLGQQKKTDCAVGN
jgi:hypothetical protein